jgi:HK97 gp10 family phage protein
VSVRLENINKLHDAVKKLEGIAVFQLNSAAASCETLAKELAPVDTGFMRDHIKQTIQAEEGSLQAVVESEADYSVYVEYGTVNQEAQPFFTPAFESSKKQLSRLRNIF